MKKKRLLNLILLALSILVTLAVAVSCGSSGDSDSDSPSDGACTHQWNRILSVDPTCVDEGTVTYKCSKCNENKQESVAATGVHLWQEISSVAPSCETAGTTVYECAHCDQEKRESVAPYGEHLWAAVSTVDPTCVDEGAVTYKCSRCGDEKQESVDPLGHNEIPHSGKAPTCGEIGWSDYVTCSRCDYTTKVELPATGEHVSAGAATAESAEICAICGQVIREATGILFDSFDVDGDAVSGKVSNSTGYFSFTDEITVNGDASFAVSLDLYGLQTVDPDAAELSVGDNVFYVAEYVDGTQTALYTVTVRRLPLYTLTFDTAGGTPVADMSVEEGETVAAPETTRTGYVFVGWSFDFSTPVTEDMEIVASWTESTETPYRVEYFLENLTKTGYDSAEQQTLYGTTGALVTAEIREFEHFKYDEERSSVSGTVSADGTLVLSVYYTRNVYTVTSELSDATVTGTGSYPYGTEVSVSIIHRLGYAPGWYSGETLLSSDAQFTFEIDGNVDVRLEILSSMEKFEFTSTYTECIVTGFKEGETSRTLTVPECVTEIAEYAFENRTDITRLNIKEGVKRIGAYAFSGCTAITTVFLPDSLTYMRSTALFGCEKFSYNEYSGAYYLGNKTNPYVVLVEATGPTVTELVIHNDAKIVFPDAFNRCPSLTYNTYDNAYYIGSETNPYMVLMKAKSTDITSCSIHPDTVYINRSAFYGCRALASAPIPEGVKRIGAFAFSQCNALVKFEIPGTVEEIGDSAFEGCALIEEIVLDDGIVSIGDYAFRECPALRTVEIPATVTKIGEGVFNGCTALTSIGVSENNLGYKSVDGNLYSDDGTVLIQYAVGKTEESFTVPAGVLEISPNAFENATSLVSITITKGVVTIGSNAFANCTKLASVQIPTGVADLGTSVFYGCTSLASVSIPEGVTVITSNMFKYCESLLSVKLPSSVLSIESWAFEGCTALTGVTFSDSLTSIGEGAFFDCASLEKADIPASVLSIGSSSFKKCSSLSEITLREGVKTIGDAVFEYCEMLTSITIPDTVTTMGGSLFYGCTSLSRVTIGAGVINIGYETFFSCTSLISVSLPSTIKTIGSNAFASCSSLVYITIPTDVTFIGTGAFKSCTALISVTIPENVTQIGQNAFDGCKALKRITFKDTEGWYATESFTNWNYKEGGETVAVSDAETNATNIKGIYKSYYWYKI